MSLRAIRICSASLALLILAACSDEPGGLESTDEIPSNLLQPSLDILDGHQPGGNEHFYFLPPLGAERGGFEGVADGDQLAVVEICLRDEDEADGCAAGQPLTARFTTNSGPAPDRIVGDGRSEYFVVWRMNWHPPERDGQYRIRVLVGGQELGHADVIALRQRDIRAYDGDLIPISDNGAFRIAFRIEEGALCSGGALGCSTGTETPGDGQPTVIDVPAQTVGGDQVVAAVVTVNDGAFVDAQGDPLPDVTVSAAVIVGPPSTDLITDDDQELPFFVEILTYPEGAAVDPDGPGVVVVICQDEDAMESRGVVHPLHPQLVLYKVHQGVTERLVSTYGSPECDATPAPEPAPGLLGMLKRGAAGALSLLGPEPVVARRLHGGLNTIIKSPSLDDAAFSVFGAALGPNADSTTAVVPPSVNQGDPVDITIQVRNALGQSLVLAGDTLDITVRGANPQAFLAMDEGAGIYTASYDAVNYGEDSLDIVLIRNDGVGLGPIGGSPYVVVVEPAALMVVNTSDGGAGSLRQAIADANAIEGPDTISFAIPGAGPHVIGLDGALPAITEEVLVDGFTQPGYAGSPVVEVASSGGYGFEIQASNTVVRGLAITGHSLDGVFAWAGLNGVRIESNTIGTDAAGSPEKGNQNAGIRLRSSNSVVRDNVISGNAQNGILVEGSAGDSIAANLIGLAPDGVNSLPNVGNGITIYDGAANTVVDGNTISGNDGYGIDLQHSGQLGVVTGTRIVDNVVGLDVNGALLDRGGDDLVDGSTVNWGPIDRGNLGGGIRILNATNTLIGVPGQGNTVSGNRGHGIEVLGGATGVLVQGNHVGVDPTGTAERSNGMIDGAGIAVYSDGPSGVLIGGTSAGQGNVISGNVSDGVHILSGTAEVTIQGNLIGTDASGTTAIGNGLATGGPCCHAGVAVEGDTDILIGGAAPGARNIVSGNYTGLWILAAPGIRIEGNLIGPDALGASYLPNVGDGGIALYGTQDGVVTGNTISGNTALAGIFMAAGPAGNQIEDNVIEDNAGPAIVLHQAGGEPNTFRTNSMGGNGFGIDLGWDGHTPNDALDADEGPNGLQNHPTITAATNGVVPGQTRVLFSVDAAAATSYTLELFSSATCSTSGWGEGGQSVYVGTLTATDGNGQLTGTADFAAVPAGSVITGTLTDPNGSTSEFSGCLTVADLDQQNLLDGGLAGQGIGRFNDINGTPDPNGTLYDLQDAQTFTVGTGGTLAELHLPVRNLSGGTLPVTLEIVGTTAGAPNDAASFGTVSLPASVFANVDTSDPTTWPVFDVRSLGITVSPGDVLAYQVRTTSTLAYIYNPEFSLGYGSGSGYRRNFAVTPAWAAASDFGFRTFVVP